MENEDKSVSTVGYASDSLDDAYIRFRCLELAVNAITIDATHNNVLQTAKAYEAYVRGDKND